MTNPSRRLRGQYALVRACLFAGSSVLATSALYGQIPAFPGADGAGAGATGGRGGIVYHVTRLDGEINGNRTVVGTLAYGLSDSNFPGNSARTIVFDVGGTIWLSQKALNTGWDTQDPISAGSTGNQSKITIAGQTAPGGITIAGGGLKLNGNNIIVRNVTIAPGYGARNTGADGMPDSYVYDAMNLSGVNQIVDHVSTYFATDETISADERASQFTVQYSNISQGQNYPQADAENNGAYTGHALGSLIQPGTNATDSWHHNLYAHQKGRLPRVGTETTKLTDTSIGAFNDFRDNVFYNWLGTAGSGASGQPSQNNFVNNYFLAGPGGDNPVGGTTPTITTAPGGTSIFSGSDSTRTKVFHSGNVKDTNKNGTAEFSTGLTNSDFGSCAFQASPQWLNGTSPTYQGVTDTPQAAYNNVLNYMGANWWTRDNVIDTVDERLIDETRHGTGQIMAWNDPTHGTEWNALLSHRMPTNYGGDGGTGIYARAVNWDTDGDGMPDWWEVAHGLDPNTADNNGDFDADGYTNLEEYLNEIAEWPAPAPIVFSNGQGDSRFAQINNWAVNALAWQPSKYDTAQINSGTVVVDAVGQHAGTLQIGSAASLTVTAGWIDVANATTVAAGGNVNVSGGLANVGALSGGGSVAVSGGMLAAKSVRVTNLNLSGTGVAQVTPDGTSAGVSRIVNLAITGGALDLTNNGLVVATPGATGSWDGSAYTGVTGSIASGRNGGDWAGSGIVTSQTDAVGATYTSLGVATAAEVLNIDSTTTAVWRGQTVSGSDTLVMYTYGGDATLDGKINIDDYVKIDSGIASGASGWSNGDFNYDGKVNIDDYTTVIDQNIGNQGPPLGGAMGVGALSSDVSAVPEPAFAGLMLVIGACLTLRRPPGRRTARLC